MSFRLKLLLLIPIAALLYIGYMNILPFGGTRRYLIDIGGKDTADSARITGPFDRISGKISSKGVTFRELETGIAYFELKSPRLMRATEVEVTVRFKDNFPEGESFRLGARDKEEWSYMWRDVYVASGADSTKIGEWRTAEASWDIHSLFISNNNLSFALSASHLEEESPSHDTIPIDWIEIRLKIPPVWRR